MDRFTIGEAQIQRVEELSVRLPFDMFGASEEILAANADWLKPVWLGDDGNWEMVVQSFIVTVDDRVIVVDPCVGNGRSLPAFPIFDNLDTPFIDRFAATGIRPEHVDAVVCTHLHSDHCGWNTVLRDGRYVPTFPNARYYMGRREVERWDHRLPGYRHIPENAGIFENSVLPILEAGLAEVIGDSHEISPSLTAELANGHTLGHMALHLCSAGRHGWFIGDAFHHPIELIHPELDQHSCEDYPLTVATRKRLIEAFIAQGALIVPAHFTAPHVGYLREEGGNRRFEPLASAQA
jgi:glyoxylase-like metal-dependent hydrolase (beta-lactamase superfamily II)